MAHCAHRMGRSPLGLDTEYAIIRTKTHGHLKLSQGYRRINQGHRRLSQGHLTLSQGHRIEY